jgi:hypothetical protein
VTALDGHDNRGYVIPSVSSTCQTQGTFPEQDPQLGDSESTCPTTYDRTAPGLSREFYNGPPASVDEVARVVYAEDGALAKILFPIKSNARKGTSGGRMGKARGARIKVFTGQARLRMREFTASIPRNLRTLEFTLTYPQDHYVDPQTAKHEHLARFKKRLQRKYGGIVAVLWRMEFQGRPTLTSIWWHSRVPRCRSRKRSSPSSGLSWLAAGGTHAAGSPRSTSGRERGWPGFDL